MRPEHRSTAPVSALALVEFDAFAPSDITIYENLRGTSISSVVPTVVPVLGGVATPGSGQEEVSLDIEMGIAIAPGLTNLLVFEAPPAVYNQDGTLNLVAYDTAAQTTFNMITTFVAGTNQAFPNQVSCSWFGFDGAAVLQSLAKMSAIGQSFYSRIR